MSLRSWGFELWDQIEKIFTFTNQGLEQLELFFRTVSDIQKIYLSLVKKYKTLSVAPSNKTKLVLESSTYYSSLIKIFQSMCDQSIVYDSQAEEIKNSVLIPIKMFLDSSKVILNDQKNELAKFKQKLEKQKGLLDMAWSRYYGAYVVKKRADAAYNRVKDDKTVPRVDIEKFLALANLKDNDLERIKSDYALCLQQFNKERCTLFLKDLPKICSELEMVDRQRAEITIEVGLALIKIQEQHLDKTGLCNTSFKEAIEMIDFRADSQSLVDTYKTTFLLPADIVFVDLVKCRSEGFNAVDFPGLMQQGGKIEKNDSAKSLFAGPGLRGIDIKEMLPEQVKQRLDDISVILPIVEKELAGLRTLFESYRKDPNMGDKSKLEPQIDVNERKLTSLKEMLDSISKYKESRTSTIGAPVNMSPRKINVSGSPDSDEEGSFDEDEEEDFDSHEAISDNVKLAKVLYRFDATDVQQMTVDIDQKVKVVQYDDCNTGWTLVHQIDSATNKGYVPTNYIQLL